MNKEQFLHTKKSLLEKMTQDNYSDGMLRKYDWLISHFEHYCEKNGIAEITLSSAADFIKECFGFEMLAARFRFSPPSGIRCFLFLNSAGTAAMLKDTKPRTPLTFRHVFPLYLRNTASI